MGGEPLTDRADRIRVRLIVGAAIVIAIASYVVAIVRTLP
jgi:hypothetical protein